MSGAGAGLRGPPLRRTCNRPGSAPVVRAAGEEDARSPGLRPRQSAGGDEGVRGPATVGAAGLWGEPRDTTSPRLGAGDRPLHGIGASSASGYGTPGSVSLTCWPPFFPSPRKTGRGARGRDVPLKERVPRESSSSTKPLKTRFCSRCRSCSVRDPRKQFAAFRPASLLSIPWLFCKRLNSSDCN